MPIKSDEQIREMRVVHASLRDRIIIYVGCGEYFFTVSHDQVHESIIQIPIGFIPLTINIPYRSGNGEIIDSISKYRTVALGKEIPNPDVRFQPYEVN